MKNFSVQRRARKPYPCDDYCAGNGRIAPGELYVYATSPPWDDIWQTGTWDHIRVCASCAYLTDSASP